MPAATPVQLVVELAEEKTRLLRLLAYGAIAFLMLGAGIVFFAMFVTVLLWEEHRLLALGLLTALFFASGAGALILERVAGDGVGMNQGDLLRDGADGDVRARPNMLNKIRIC